MERYKPLPRMHGTGGPSSPHDGVADRNVSARWAKAARAIVAGLRHREIGLCRTLRLIFSSFSLARIRARIGGAHSSPSGSRSCAPELYARTRGSRRLVGARRDPSVEGALARPWTIFRRVLARAVHLYIITGTWSFIQVSP